MTQRKASMNLDWHEGVNGLPSADLPDIPGYPCKGGRHWQVNFDNISSIDTYEFLGYGFYISLRGAHHGKTLEEYDFGFGPVDTTDEVKQEVESLSPEEIAQAAEDAGVEPVDGATASRKATRRKASMTLDWEDLGDDAYEAALPAIPGYQGSYPNEVRVCSRPKDDDVWLFEMLIGVGDEQVPLYNYDFGIPYGGSADEMMDAVENLDPQDVASVLGDFGFAPEEGTTAGRHAMRRKADMNLNWEQDDVAGSWFAELPAIPGYPCADGYSNHVQVADQSGLEGTDWAFYMYLELQKETVHLYNEDFGIPDTATAEEMMDIIENLSLEDIADALQAEGYMPEED